MGIWDASWALLEIWKPLEDAVGGFGSVLRAILAVFGALGGVLGASWKFFEASWRRSQASWNTWRHLGGVLGVLEGIWRPLGDVLGGLEGI